MNAEIVKAKEIIRRYSIAIYAVAVVFAFTILLTNLVETNISTLYLAAIMFAAWRGGLGAGLLATVLSVAIATFFFLPPVYSFSLKAEGIVELVVFALAAVLTSSLSAARERALELEQLARREAEEANRVKDEFLAAVSHELRTPLATIKTLTRFLLRKDPPAKERHEYLEDIASECERQIDFVHNLLDVSYFRAGGVRVDLGRVDPASVIRTCEKFERVGAAEHGHELIVAVEPDLPFVQGDESALRRSICAMLENAIKYTPKGGRIQLRAREDGSQVLIEIADNGRGIHPKDLPYVFDRFYRGHAGSEDVGKASSEVSGIGLGLHLAHGLIESMNGTISVESQRGSGTTFKIQLPIWNETVWTETRAVIAEELEEARNVA